MTSCDRSVTPFDSSDRSRSRETGVTGGEVKRFRPWLMMCLFPVSLLDGRRCKRYMTHRKRMLDYRLEDQEW